MWNQVKFKVTAPNRRIKNDFYNIFGGLAEMMTDSTTGEVTPVRIICGCCGDEFKPEEVEILKIYKDWVSLTDAIIEE